VDLSAQDRADTAEVHLYQSSPLPSADAAPDGAGPNAENAWAGRREIRARPVVHTVCVVQSSKDRQPNEERS